MPCYDYIFSNMTGKVGTSGLPGLWDKTSLDLATVRYIILMGGLSFTYSCNASSSMFWLTLHSAANVSSLTPIKDTDRHKMVMQVALPFACKQYLLRRQITFTLITVTVH